MTDEQINKEIAEACGWVYAPEDLRDFPWQDEQGEVYTSYPNYCNDLNAMHEAEKILNSAQRIIYADQICIIWTGRDDRPVPMWFWITEATARQRAEAFLRTLGKWEEKA